MPFFRDLRYLVSSWMGALLLRIEICHMQNLLSSDQTQLLGDLVNLSVCARKSWKKYKGKKLIWFQCTAIISKILPQVGAVKLCLLSYVSRSWCKIAVTLFGLRDFFRLPGINSCGFLASSMFVWCPSIDCIIQPTKPVLSFFVIPMTIR